MYENTKTQNTVKGEGSKTSKLWIIGEAPGAQEERTGKPFCGGSGQVLNSILSEVGIKRSEAYVDNIIQQRPKGNDFGVFYKDKSRRQPIQLLLEAHQQIKFLVREFKPNVVVALGNEALYALTGLRYITKWRGSIINLGGVKVIPTIHPAMVMRQYEFRPVVVMDFHRIKKEAQTSSFPIPYKDNLIINPTYDKVLDTLQFLHKQPKLTFDIETLGKQILCLGIGWSKQDAICIPIFYVNNSWWTSAQEFAIISAIRHLFKNPEIKFIAQNAQFDMIYLKDKWDVDVSNLYMDTMIAFHTLYPEMRKGLDFLTSIYTNRPYYKDSYKGGPDQMWHYNCLDCVATFECAEEIEKELTEFGTRDFYFQHSHQLIKPLMDIQRRGVRIDNAKRIAIDKRLTIDIEQMQARLDKAVGHPLNPNSPKQMKDFLYTELKLPPKRNRKTGSLSADEDTITELSRRFPNPIFELVLDIRKARKLLSTYIRAPLDEDERIRCSYVITGTKTGRLSSRESIYGMGTNLQNIPRGEIVRAIFIPDPGKVFINADLSQAEARVVAFLAEDNRLQALFERQGDIHKYNAGMVFSKAIAEVTPDERQLAKTLVHAANYGIGARTFSRHIGTSEARARELLNQYYALYPGIKRWHIDVKDELSKKRLMVTPFGRKRMFFGRWGSDMIREAIAYVPQSTVSDYLNWGIIKAYPNLPQGWEIMLQVHDSILMQVPIATDDMHIYKFIKHYFENTLEIKHNKFKIPIQIKVGLSWGKLKPMEV